MPLPTVDDDDEEPSYSININTEETKRMSFSNMFEIHDEKDTIEGKRQISSECDIIKAKVDYDQDEEQLKVVKGDEGEFYIIKHSKIDHPKSILKTSQDLEVEGESDHAPRGSVFFNLQDNEIKDFKKGTKVTWQPFKLKKSQSEPSQRAKKGKAGKKGKGKGKNRQKNEAQQKQKELDKIRKAEEKRKEREELEAMVEAENDEENSKQNTASPFASFIDENLDVEGIDDEEEDLEACNAPSTRKSSSVPNDMAKSPYFGDILMSFSTQTETKETVPEKKPADKVIKSAIKLLDVPTKADQLERDLKSMKADLEAQRDYLVRIDPDNLSTIFKSSIEFETVLNITKALQSGPQKWVNSHSEYLAQFMTKLTQVERFDMAVMFCSDDEKQDIFKLISSIESSLLAEKEQLNVDEDSSTLDTLISNLEGVRDVL